MAASYAIGIDLGTTYSCVAVPRDGKAEIVANDDGDRTTPSWVAFTKDERLLGKAAKEKALEDAVNSLYDMKRLIGRNFDDEAVQTDMKSWPFRVWKGRNGTPRVQVEYQGQMKVFTPQEVSAMVLTKMKETAMAYLGAPDDARIDVVITVPAYFSNSQRQATKDAGEIAGMNVLGLLAEPTAAGIAYGIDRYDSRRRNVLIFDLGGGTFDVSILTITGGNIEVLATSGDTHLGGQDFDNRMEGYLLKEFERMHGVSIADNANARSRLRAVCESAKRRLSTYEHAPINVFSIVNGINFTAEIRRARFEDLCADLFQSTIDCVEQCLDDTNLQKSQIDDIVLVGGSTRIPKVRQLLSNFFGGKQLKQTINPDEAVAYGAAIQAALLSDHLSHSLQAVKLVDVTPLSLGIEIKGELMANVIDRNTRIPTKRVRNFTTCFDYESAVTLQVYEGERAMVKENHRLGSFELSGIQHAQAGIPQIDVTFELDANGILNVTAEDRSTKSSNAITIAHDLNRLSATDIQRMVAEAARFKKADEERRQLVTAKNELEAFCIRKKRAAQVTALSMPASKKVVDVIEGILAWLASANNNNITFSGLKAQTEYLARLCASTGI